jgi:phosphoglycerate dehydrogenase-like enzyme
VPYRCAILDDYQGVALKMADWGRLSPDVEVEDFRDRINGHDNLVNALKDFEILCVMRERTPLPATLIEALPKLKMIMSTGGQNLSIDVAAANRRGIVVCNTSALPHPTVELTFALMLELARQPGRESERMKNGKFWQDRVGVDLCGRTLGIVGLGRLGAATARIGKAFGMKVMAWSPNLTPEKCADVGVDYATKDALFLNSDVVSVHMQLSPRTQHMIGATELAQMQSTAFLINTSRGELIEEAALVKALGDKKIAGFGVDVYAEEPLPADHPLRKLPNVVLTPHIGFVTEDNYRTYYGGAVDGIRAWLDGKPIRVAKPVT